MSAHSPWRNFKKPSLEVLKSQLTELQFKVTQKEGTEPPFENEYNAYDRPGLYVDIVSGEPLFTSLDKFDSGTGWPSFTRPVTENAVKTHLDFKLLYPRKEVRSALADSHLGHVFSDGPEPTGLRYCMNSAALRFIPAESLETEGYSEFAPLFRKGETQKTLHTEQAVFAGGCFWCMEPPFRMLDGVSNVESGYTGGTLPDPTYEQVCSDTTGHYEAVRVTYDPSIISYDRLLQAFWENIDPTDGGGQFADRGSSYRTAIFYTSEEQREQAERSKSQLQQSKFPGRILATEIVRAGPFYLAEDHHQNYAEKNPSHYSRYKVGSGRAGFIESMWKNKK